LIAALRPYQLYALLTLAIGLNFYLIANEFYFALAYPLAILILIVALYATDKVLLFIVFFTPLSLNLSEFEAVKAGFYFPTEPLLFGIMVLYLMRVLAGDGIGRQFMRHPITIAIFVYLGWILVTSLTSSMFLVSIKFFVVKLWFVISCYFFAKEIFRDYKNMKRFVWLYIIPFTGVILYTVIRHSTFDFTQETAHWVMEPFFKDHTSYGALLAMFFPLVVGFMFNTKYNALIRTAIFVVVVIFAIGILLSYTRAAWVSLVGAFAVFLVMKLRIDFKLLVVLGVAVGGLFALNYDRIMMQLEKNDQDSSDDIGEHVQSISNISSDASNLERLLRWNCAVRMFKDRPVFGFGPGTYQFQYATYQFSGERTIISTNFGDGGNAHSEYLGPLAESGLLGMLTFGFLVTVVLYRGIRLYYQIDDPEMKILLMGVLLGLITYVTHGVLNNYLDTDKASVPFFGFIAIIVAIDLYHGPQSPSRLEEKAAAQ
jgi:O-antigen ligase